jgi:hypothetical protein
VKKACEERERESVSVLRVCAGEREKRIGEKKKIFVVNFCCKFLWAKWSSSFL